MTRSGNPRILFSPCYAEPLKAMLPLIDALKSRYDVFVLNTISDSVDDKDKSEALLLSRQIPFVSETENTHTEIEQQPLWIRTLCLADRRFGRFSKRIAADVIESYATEARRRRLSCSWLDKVRPSVLVVGGETNPIQKHLINECNRRGIPSITLQWGIANASARHTQELLERFERRESSNFHGFSRRSTWRLKLVRWLTDLTLRCTGLRVPVPSRIFGGGHATIFAVIGQGCYENYVGMGIPPNKMVVVGYPIYEQLYRDAGSLTSDQSSRRSLFESLGLCHDRALILWCTNDQRTYYEGFCTYEELLQSWKRKIEILLELGDCYEILVKIHPKERAQDYQPLEALSSRVHVLEEYDVRKMIPHCSLFITRFSSTAVDALCLGRPVMTHNYPRIPGGTLYEDIGGTVHVMSDQEFRISVKGILENGMLMDLVSQRRERFLPHFLDFGDEPSTSRFVRLCDKLIEGRARIGDRTAVLHLREFVTRDLTSVGSGLTGNASYP